MEPVQICTSASNQSYAFLGYSSSGNVLASQSEAEHELTIWDWQTATILLQYRNPTLQGIFDLKFSHHNDRTLFTGGVKKLNFWDIIRTFTGLKLVRHDGRFGKFQTCDILNVCVENENRILTNCDWGNILVWENGCIKFEIYQKNRQPCHSGIITQIYSCDERLFTVGMDNFLKIWFWDIVSIGNMREDEKIFEIESIYEFEISSGGSDNFLSFAIDTRDDPICYVKDGDGIIWKCCINKDLTAHHSEPIFRANSNDLVDIDVAPCSNFLASFDHRGVLRIYNYVEGSILFYYRFSVNGCAIIWSSREVI